MRLLLTLCLMLLAGTEASFGGMVVFSELGLNPAIDVNGLHSQGVLYGFTNEQATYNGVIGTSSNTVFSVDPVLSGPTTGTLLLTFDDPTPLLAFDIVLQSIFAIDDSSLGENGGPAYSVLLSTGVTLTGSTAPQPDGFYSEGRFQYSGAAITSASITFFNGLDAGGMPVQEFGIDNLSFGDPNAFAAPEPGTSLLIAAGLIGLGSWKRKLNRRS